MGDYEAIDRIDRGGGSVELRPGKISTTKTVASPAVTLTLDDTTVLCDTSANSITVNLPTAASAKNKVYNIKKINALNTVTIDPAGAETIDGALTQVIAVLFASLAIVSDGATWWII